MVNEAKAFTALRGDDSVMSPPPSVHKDLVTDVALDISGRRMATCSADKTMAIWDRDEDGKWHKSAFWKVHGGVVWKARWAHPEFGQVLATCSGDRSVHIWEEVHKDSTSNQGKWIRKAYLTDSRNGVTDIVFAPRHMGLMLAAVSVQGVARIYEAPDCMDLSKWSMVTEMQAFHTRCGCVAWSQSWIHKPLLIIGSDDARATNEDRIVVYEYADTARKFQRISSLRPEIHAAVTDMQMSPILSDDYHQVAVAAMDIYIYNLMIPSSSFVEEEFQSEAAGLNKYSLMKVCQLSVGPDARVYRVRFGLTGELLTAASSNGDIHMWKSICANRWIQMSKITADDVLAEDEEYVFKAVQTSSRQNKAYRSSKRH